MGEIWSALVGLLYPPTCYSCGADGDPSFCTECLGKIEPARSPCCTICGQPFATRGDRDHLCGNCVRRRPSFDRARACVLYDAHDDDSPLRLCLHAYKYERRAEYAAPLAHLMKRFCPYELEDYDALIPVPLHRDRLRWRGFNQALLLIKSLELRAARLDVFSLVRARPTVPQVELSESERHDNVRRAFAVMNPERIRGQRILLVDDVMTTGATVHECAKVLKRAGAKRVDVLVLARAIVR